MPGAERGGDEFALIRRYLFGLDQGPSVVLGNGDDAAVLALADGEELVVSADVAVAAIHFPVGSAAEKISYRAVGAAASDLAAMGATPLAMTLTLTMPAADPVWLERCREGLAAAVREFSLPLIGGDVSSGPLSLGVQVLGSVPAGSALRRDGAMAGDLLCVSGTLGDAAAGLELLRDGMAGSEAASDWLLDRFWRPRPALQLGRSLRGVATAAIDISDGLMADAGHLARASAVQLRIDSGRLPISRALGELVDAQRALQLALSGGEDYELCFTVPRDAALPNGCCVIGSVEQGEGVICDVLLDDSGYRHFK